MLVLGVVGIFVPLLPTTPFLLLAAWAFCRSSPRLYDRLLAHPCLGAYVRNFREYRAIPLRAKIISVTLIWATLLYCIFGVVRAWWWAQGMAVVMMLTVPLLFAFSGKERKAIPVVVFNALLFGFLISAAERYL